MRHIVAVLFLFASIACFSAPSLAQDDVLVFPETGHTLRGAFRVFWENFTADAGAEYLHGRG